MRTGHKEGEMQFACCFGISTAPEAEQLSLLSLHSEKQESYNVTPLPESLCFTLFAAVYKRPPEGGLGAFCFLPLASILGFGLCFSLWAFALGFLVWEAFGREKNY
jgi:hypothetical protein